MTAVTTSFPAPAAPAAPAAPPGPAAPAALSRIVMRVAAVLAVTAVGAVVVVAALFDLETMVSSADAQIYRLIVARLEASEGRYYADGIDHKGPLWMLVYHGAYLLSPALSTYWFVIAAFALVVAAATGYLLARALKGLAVPPLTAGVVGAGTALYVTLGREEYSWVLYGRNLVALLTVGAVAAIAALPRDRAASSRPSTACTALVAGLALGLAVQTVPSAALPVLVLAGWLVVDSPHRRAAVAGIGGLLGAFVAAPVWFAARGRFDTYWFCLVTYNRAYQASIGKEFGAQAAEGLRETGRYYLDHPIFAAVIVLFAVLTAAGWIGMARPERRRRVFILAWWAAEVVALVAAGRYYPHYWITAFVPTMVMAALVADDARARLSLPALVRFAPAVVGACVLIAVLPRFDRGLALAAEFEGFAPHDAEVLGAYGDAALVHRAVAHGLTGDDEHVYAWAREAWMVNLLDRPPAARFNPRTWLIGVFPGAASDAPRGDFPWTWEALGEDLAATPPTLIVEYQDRPIPTGSTLDQVMARYTLIYDGPGTAAGAPLPLDPVRVWAAVPLAQLSVVGACTIWSGPASSVNRVLFPGAGANGADLAFAVGPTAVTATSSAGPTILTELARPSDADLALVVHDDAAVLIAGERVIGALTLLGRPAAALVDGQPLDLTTLDARGC